MLFYSLILDRCDRHWSLPAPVKHLQHVQLKSTLSRVSRTHSLATGVISPVALLCPWQESEWTSSLVWHLFNVQRHSKVSLGSLMEDHSWLAGPEVSAAQGLTLTISLLLAPLTCPLMTLLSNADNVMMELLAISWNTTPDPHPQILARILHVDEVMRMKIPNSLWGCEKAFTLPQVGHSWPELILTHSLGNGSK